MNKLCQLACLKIRRIGSTQQSLFLETTRTLVSSLVLSRLNYRSALLNGSPQVLLDKIQRVRDCSSRFIYKAPKYAYITPLRPRGLTFTWWGCYGLCVQRKPTELVHSVLFCSCVYFSLMALSTIFYSINAPNSSPLSHSVHTALFLSHWSFQLYISF